MPVYDRDYAPVRLALNSIAGDRQRRMREAVDVLWPFLKDHGVSWVGFYAKDAEAEQMVLGPSRDTPACSPIGLHGACGMCWSRQRPIIVNDVHNLGRNYIACDPRDKSEIVIPLFDEHGACYAVLDLDSHERNAFGEHDARALRDLMVNAGISWPHAIAEPLHF